MFELFTQSNIMSDLKYLARHPELRINHQIYTTLLKAKRLYLKPWFAIS